MTVPLDPHAVLWSAPENERAGRPLLVMLHGWSYDETHLFALAPDLPEDLVVASVRAPFSEAGGYAWFPSQGNPIGDPQPSAAALVTESVATWLDTIPAPSSIGLLGFSQGGGMVLELLRHSPDRFAYGVQLAGFVVSGSRPGDTELSERRPPVFWGRGDLDRVIPQSAIHRTESWMATHTTAETHVYHGLGHDVAGQEIPDLSAFVSRQIQGGDVSLIP